MKKGIILSMSFLLLFSLMSINVAGAEEEDKECVKVPEQMIRVKSGEILKIGNLRMVGTIQLKKQPESYTYVLSLRANLNRLRWEEISQPRTDDKINSSNKVYHAEDTDPGTPFLMYQAKQGMQATIVSCGSNIIIGIVHVGWPEKYRLSFAQF